MKRWVWIFLAGLSCSLAWSEDGYRIFTDSMGRAISARILQYDARKQTVLVQMENGQQGRIPVSKLSDDDKKYILAWNNAQGFMNERQFRIECEDKTLEEKKEEVRKDFRWGGGDVDKDRLMNVITRERIAYEFAFRNLNETPLSGIRMEYRIYYEQSEMTRDASTPETVQKTLKGSLSLDTIPGKGSIKIVTEPVEIHEDDINEIGNIVGGDRRRGGKGDLHGIRTRFFLTLSTGDEVMREFTHPDSLSDDDYPWE